MKKYPIPAQDISWQDASEETLVCYCRKIDKGTICSAIKNGACDIKAIQRATMAGAGGRCEQLNPRRRCCHPDIAELLRLYGTGIRNQRNIDNGTAVINQQERK